MFNAPCGGDCRRLRTATKTNACHARRPVKAAGFARPVVATFRRLENAPAKSLLPRLLADLVLGQTALAIMLFVPATVHFWQGWAFFAVSFVLSFFMCLFYQRLDPELLARRMLRREKIGAQKIILLLLKLLYAGVFLVCGFDHRCGWTPNFLMPVPAWLSVLALLGYAGANLLLVPVMNANRYAASIIRVETGQILADRGPYRLVRHPMYAVGILLWFWIPLALGSFVALPLALLIIPVLVWRLLNEEKMLRRDLPGYTDYCQRTRHRLIPSIW
jgi:protein-S-isoprenylcysteine O-methyltransferase Ste14